MGRWAISLGPTWPAPLGRAGPICYSVELCRAMSQNGRPDPMETSRGGNESSGPTHFKTREKEIRKGEVNR